MIYLDQAATSLQKPPEVHEAVSHAMQTCASVGRSGHAAAMAASDVVYNTRREAADFFDAEPEQVVFTMNATHGLNMAINTLVGPGSRVVISGFEHNAVVRPLYRIGARVVVAGSRLFDPVDTVSDFEQKITEDTEAVICTHVSNVFGYILPVEEIAAICRRCGVPLVIDAAQSAGVLPISLKETGAAFIAMPGHKGLYGPQGTGILLCGQIPKPLLCGGTGSGSQMPEMPDFLPDIGEAGTHNVPGIAGLLEGIRYIRRQGIASVRAHEQNLLEYFKEKAFSDPKIRLFTGEKGTQTGVISFQIKDRDCEIVAQNLAEQGIAVRAGLHCAPLAHRSAETIEKGTIRVSFSAYNSYGDVLELIKNI